MCPSIGTILCAECWCCLCSLLGYGWVATPTRDTRKLALILPTGRVNRKDDRQSQPHLVLIQHSVVLTALIKSMTRLHVWDESLSSRMAVCAEQAAPWGAARPILKALELSGHGIPWILAAIIGILQGDAESRIVWVNVLLALLLDLIIVGTMKALVRRPRPSINRPDMFATISVDCYSFPSGHSTRVAMLATILFLLPDTITEVFFLYFSSATVLVWVFSVAISRVLLGRHHVSDVLCGLAIGYGQAYVMTILWLQPEVLKRWPFVLF
uniref:Phospholipid phosphatase 6 n=1 Tax=Eptatretus burgeri TaxID=7764 RepID=A0A8C4NA79_EPTBU